MLLSVLICLFQIVDPSSGKTLPVGQTGEIHVKGPQVCKGYYKNQTATDESIVNGWLHTGELTVINIWYELSRNYEFLPKEGLKCVDKNDFLINLSRMLLHQETTQKALYFNQNNI